MEQRNKEKFNSFSSVIKFISGVISWTILVVLVIVALFLLYYFVSTKLYAKEGEKFKPAFALYTILSPSMVPNINVYDVIVDINVKHPEDVKVGDVITFSSTASLTPGMTITHRVVDIKQDEKGYSYLTKGDANVSPDGAYVPYENIYGKVIFRIPQLGRLQEFLGTQGGWLLVVVLPALAIIISDLLKIFRLKTAKNQVDGYTNLEQQQENNEKVKKEKIEENLTRRYANKRKENEPDPIPSKKYVILDKNPTRVPLELPKKIELPKLKNELPQKKKKNKK